MNQMTIYLIGLLLTMGFISLNAMLCVWAERKIAGRMQRRPGPTEAGPFGLLQTIADGIKLMTKDLLAPRNVDTLYYVLAPAVVVLPVFISFAVIPFGEKFQIRDINVGILVILAFASLNVLGLLMAGWGSNNKYSLIGSLRSVAQNISYEIVLILALLPVVMITGSLSMQDVVRAQSTIPFILVQPLAFIIYFIGGLAETNRTPFDLPEAESELVAGYHTEYPGMRFSLFFLAEYTNMVLVSAVATTFFLGGWHGPLLPGPVWFLLKTYLLVFVIIWLRWTFPRVRFDQLLNFCWKLLIPVLIVNLLVTAGVLKLL
jgi:NADH-quinone oxidoreductase subunit H